MPVEIKYYFLSFFIALLVLGLFIILLATLYSRKQQKNKNEKNLMQIHFNQALLQTQIEIQEQTFKNISEEIHDNIGQVLSLAKLNLNTFPHDVSEAVKKRLADTVFLVSKAIDDLRDLSQSMHGDKITSIGLKMALERELKLIQNTGKFTTALLVDGEGHSVGSQQEMVLFRIVQESLNNAVKHSHGQNIQITLQYTAAGLTLQVKDDGAGFDAALLTESASGIGLKSMQNRATLIGAIFTVQSAPGKGTTIIIALKQINKIS